MRITIPSLFGLALCALTPRVGGGTPPMGEDRTASADSEDRVGLWGRVEPVLEAWEAALADWEARGRGLPHPAASHWSDFEALVAGGWGAGRTWLLRYLDEADLPPSRRDAARPQLVDAILATGDRAPVGAVEIALLELEEHADDLTSAERRARVERLLIERGESAIQAAGGVALARMLLIEVDPAAETGIDPSARVEPLLRSIVEENAGQSGTRRAASMLWEWRESDYRDEVERWVAAWSDGLDETDPGAHPITTYWPRMRHLADAGAGRALWWMVREAKHRELAEVELAQLRIALLEELIARHGNERWIRDVVQFSEMQIDEIGVENLDALGERLLAQVQEPSIRAWVLHGLATLAALDEGDEVHVERATAMFEALQRDHPDDPLALASAARLFELRHLRVGQVPPERSAQDGRGQPLALSQFRGQVCLFVFWGHWSPQCQRDLERVRELELTLAGEPFVVVGVNTDDDPDAARARSIEQGLTWRNVYEGRRSGPWTSSWSVRDFPYYFLLDPQGRIAFKGAVLSEVELGLESVLEALRAERRPPTPDVEETQPPVEESSDAPPDPVDSESAEEIGSAPEEGPSVGARDEPEMPDEPEITEEPVTSDDPVDEPAEETPQGDGSGDGAVSGG